MLYSHYSNPSRPYSAQQLSRNDSSQQISQPVSHVGARYEQLQARAAANRKTTPHESSALSHNVAGANNKNSRVGELKDFYAKRLRNDTRNSNLQRPGTTRGNVATKNSTSGFSIPGGAAPSRIVKKVGDDSNTEMACNNCFEIITMGTLDEHSRNCFGVGSENKGSAVDLINIKLRKLIASIKLRQSTSKGTKMNENLSRNLAALSYHLQTALDWRVGVDQNSILSEHTINSVKTLSVTAKNVAPALYVFSKRVENVIMHKANALRVVEADINPNIIVDKPERLEAVEVNSVISALDSDCGTRVSETQVTEGDVGDIATVNAELSSKSEDDLRRMFYSQCLQQKLAMADKEKARKVLISDLYNKVKQQQVDPKKWVAWISQQLHGESLPQGQPVVSGVQRSHQVPNQMAPRGFNASAFNQRSYGSGIRY